jgi:hypothetical protein
MVCRPPHLLSADLLPSLWLLVKIVTRFPREWKIRLDARLHRFEEKDIMQESLRRSEATGRVHLEDTVQETEQFVAGVFQLAESLGVVSLGHLKVRLGLVLDRLPQFGADSSFGNDLASPMRTHVSEVFKSFGYYLAHGDGW